MTTYKEKLVMFVKLKRNHIKKFGFIYANHKDYKSIRSWSEESCKIVYEEIVSKIMSFHTVKGLSSLTCPWCIYHNSNCAPCYYGKRYGICSLSNSAYKKYATDDVRESLTNEVYRAMIYKINQ